MITQATAKKYTTSVTEDLDFESDDENMDEMPPLLERQDRSNSESDDDESKPAGFSKHTNTRPTQKVRKNLSVQNPTAKSIQTYTNAFVEKSSDDDVLNE